MRRVGTLAAAALATSVFCGSAAAQDNDLHDHSATDHGEMDHSAMDGAEADHSAMDHGEMDHSTMDHGETDHSAMDHGQMDHSAMDHGPLVPDQPGNASAPLPPTDHAADAIFGPAVMAASRDHLYEDMHFTGFVVGVDLLEYRAGKGADGYVIEGEAWYGGDIDRAVLAYTAEGAFGESPETVELNAYWRHAINPWFNLQLGVRHDFQPGPERTYALVGIQGLAPYWVEVEAQAFLSEKGDMHLRGTAMHDMRLTQRLVFEPEVAVDIALQDVPELGIGSGLDMMELAGRLRFEIERNFAPYVGVAWERKFGDSADFARDEGEDASSLTVLAGLRFWF